MRRIARYMVEAICIISVIIIIAASAMLLTGARPAVVTSGSMEPTIMTGSLIIMSSETVDLKENEIVAFERGGAIVVHRLVRKTRDGWMTRGDANKSDDPWTVSEDNIKGKAIFWIPKIGYLVGRGV